MDQVHPRKFNRSFLRPSLLAVFGLLLAAFWSLPNAAADTPKKGGFYNLSGGVLGKDYMIGGTALIDWRDFEPEEGQYRWELLTNPKATYMSWASVFGSHLQGKQPDAGPVPGSFIYGAHAAGKKMRLKLRVTEGAVPLWLYGGEDAQGKRSSSYGTTCGYKTWAQVGSGKPDCNPQTDILIAVTYPLYPEKEDNAEPVWWNPIFQEKLKRVVKVIGQFVESDPVYSTTVEFMEASVGSYGEMILYGKSDTFQTNSPNQKMFRAAGYTNAGYSESVQNLVAAYMEAFPTIPIALSLGNGLYAGAYDDGSGVNHVESDVGPKLMERYGSRLYLKFAGFGGGGNRQTHLFGTYCPVKTRCIYESFGGIAGWNVDGIEFPFFCYANRPIPERKADANGKRPECKPSPCWKCVNGEEERIIEPTVNGVERFRRVLDGAVVDRAYIVMMWHGDMTAIEDARAKGYRLTDGENIQVREGFDRVFRETASKLWALGAVDPQAPPTFSLTVDKGGAGTGTVAGANISCGNGCTGAQNVGTLVPLTATPNEGSTFAGWSGACAGTGPCNLVMDGNKTVVAQFHSASGTQANSAVSPSTTGASSNPATTLSADSGGAGEPSGTNNQNTGGADQSVAPSFRENRARQGATVVDLDGDGKDDLVLFGGEPGPVYAWYSHGDRLTKANIQRDVETPNWKMAGGGNIKSNGSYNIFWQNEVSGKVFAWSMNRGSYLAEHYIQTVEDTNWRLVGVGDFNGDGHADLLWQHQGTGAVFIWFMNGLDFARDQSVAKLEDLRWQVVGVGDLDGDGKADILWYHPSGALYVWYMDGAKLTKDQHIRDLEDSNWKVIGIGRFTESKNMNIMWRHQVSGEVYIWYLDRGKYLGDSRLNLEEEK